MFSFTALFTLTTLALSAAAGGIEYESQCNTGPVQCCNSLQDAQSSEVTGLLALVGIDIGAITGQVGLQCSPLSVIGVGSVANCVSQPVCCEDNKFGGLIAVGCSPINVGL
ncbi:Fruiting body protein SC1 [Hypsizygus marmoreus]|uniref:Hydrophobin n=1 Tax=Hypsizygus marmoreus TaxID=39966 RepID=A0A369JJV0_HYPMA|nr:Fruiting body protein SC1 [Hypsizygus marmoreus]